MEDSKGKTLNNVVNFAADGDIILVVGPEKKRFRVHSLFLKTASKPFLVMFGPNWQEGHDLFNHEGPMELSLPEDNAAALEIIFAIIHHQNNQVPRSIPARRVLDVAITTDKYDFINAMKLASEALLRTKKRGADDLMFLTAAAYLFQNAQAFKEITKALILKYPAPYLNLACKEIESVLTWRVFRLLEQQRSFASLELSEILISGINEGTGTCVHMCVWTCKCKYAYAYLNLLKYKQLLPANLLGISVSEAIEAVEKMADPIPRERSIACNYEYNHAPLEYRKGRSWSLKRLKTDIGLCLQCVRSGSSNPEGYCNHAF